MDNLTKEQREHAFLISIYRKAKQALEAMAVESPNLFKFEELARLSEAVDSYEDWRSKER